jgi:predicted enzyme related to lactoylglutathione lyase
MMNQQPMNPVVHFEMPAEDRERMADFYTKAFGWKTTLLGADMGNYVLATTDASTPEGMGARPATPGTINGGFYERTKPDQGTVITIGVEDIHDAMKRVTEAGGTVLGGMQNPGEPDMIPGVGLYATIIDTEGNRVSLLQPQM